MTATARQIEPFDGAEPSDLLWLDLLCETNGYFCPVILPRRRYAVLRPFAFTWAILVGDLFDGDCYCDRWCFETFPAAAKALLDWKRLAFSGEPEGWHRHPDSGRRRPGGDKSLEYTAI